MYEVGRICIKLAGRDAGKEAVIVDILDDKYVLIDGNVRRRKCNIMHLEPTSKMIEVKKKASHAEVKTAFEKINLGVWETKPRQTVERPKKVRVKKETKKEDKKVKEVKKKSAETKKPKSEEGKKVVKKSAKKESPEDKKKEVATKKVAAKKDSK